MAAAETCRTCSPVLEAVRAVLRGTLIPQCIFMSCIKQWASAWCDYPQKATSLWAYSLRPCQRNLLVIWCRQSHEQDSAQENAFQEMVCSASKVKAPYKPNSSLLLTLQGENEVRRAVAVAETPPCSDRALHHPLQRAEDKNSLARHTHRTATKCWLRHENKAKNPSLNYFREADGCFEQQLSHPAVPEICVSITRHERAGMFHYWDSN